MFSWSGRSTLRAVALAIVVSAAFAVAGCGGGGSSGGSGGGSKSVKLGVLYYDTGNSNWSKAYRQSLDDAIASIGAQDRIKLTNVMSVPYTPEATAITQRLFADGDDAVLEAQTLGRLYNTACAASLDKQCLSYYPADRKEAPKNVSGFYPRLWQGAYVEGVAAGLLTRSDIVGFVGAYELPNNVALVNGLTLGCRSVNPKCQVRPVYINSYFDPPKATQAAQTLIDAGADVLDHYQDDPSIIKLAQSRGKWAFGLYMPSEASGPDAYVTGLMMRPGLTKYWEQTLPQLLNGSFKPKPLELWGLDRINFLDTWGPKVPADVKAKADKVVQEIRSGKDVFTGPIADNNGTVRIPKGQSISDDMFYDGMTWYVKGVNK